jgi:hypothetical protein
MAIYSHYTATGPFQFYKGQIHKVKVQVNAALTGTITLADETATAGTPAVAVITNPTVGSQYEVWGIQNGLSVNPSTTCDITVSGDLSRSGV